MTYSITQIKHSPVASPVLRSHQATHGFHHSERYHARISAHHTHSRHELKEMWLHLFRVKKQVERSWYVPLPTASSPSSLSNKLKSQCGKGEQDNSINSQSSCLEEHRAFTWVCQATEATKKQAQGETSAQPLCNTYQSPCTELSWLFGNWQHQKHCGNSYVRISCPEI